MYFFICNIALSKFDCLKPKFCSTNSFYLAQTLQALGRKEEAIEYYKAAFLKPVISADDKEAHEKVCKCNFSDSIIRSLVSEKTRLSRRRFKKSNKAGREALKGEF